MQTIFSDQSNLQNAQFEYIRGRQVSSFENPRRAQMILDRIDAVKLGPVAPPEALSPGILERVHSVEFLAFLSGFWDVWQAENGDVDALPNAWVPPRARALRTRRPGAELGRYCVDMSSAIQEGTWSAATAAAACAATGAMRVIEGERGVFALCRPPGHHAGMDFFGGYCFLNNAAVAAQTLRDAGCAKVAVLDVDYHHGNGTQDIFFRRGDVLTVSIHADPADEYPYYSGYPDETGEDEGEGANLNLPQPWGTDWRAYDTALSRGLDRIADFGADALVVSLGVDTFGGDPISRFDLKGADYSAMGQHITDIGLPTVFVMEGGYAVEDIGMNVVNVLAAFDAAAGDR